MTQHVGLQSRGKDVVTQDQLTALGQVFRVETIAATSVGQTSFTVPSGYTVGAIIVFVNGALQQPADYTATSGTAVVLATGTTSIQDAVQVVVLSSIRAQDDALLSYTVAGLPAASANARKIRWCSNMSSGAAPVYSDGTNWRKFSDNTIVTT